MILHQDLSMRGILGTEADKKPMITCDNRSYSVHCMSYEEHISVPAHIHPADICCFPFDSRTIWPQERPHFTTLQPQQKGIPHNPLRHRQERPEKECSDVPMFWHPHCSEPPPPSLINQSWAFVLQELGRFTAMHASQKSPYSVTTLADQELSLRLNSALYQATDARKTGRLSRLTGLMSQATWFMDVSAQTSSKHGCASVLVCLSAVLH